MPENIQTILVSFIRMHRKFSYLTVKIGFAPDSSCAVTDSLQYACAGLGLDPEQHVAAPVGHGVLRVERIVDRHPDAVDLKHSRTVTQPAQRLKSKIPALFHDSQYQFSLTN